MENGRYLTPLQLVAQEMEALTEEAARWKKLAERAQACLEKRRTPPFRPDKVCVEVREWDNWWRVYINDVYIDGYEDEGSAKRIAARVESSLPEKESDDAA
jgi:hypothetical protein